MRKRLCMNVIASKNTQIDLYILYSQDFINKSNLQVQKHLQMLSLFQRYFVFHRVKCIQLLLKLYITLIETVILLIYLNSQLKLIPIMIFYSYKMKVNPNSHHKTANSLALLSKSQSFRNIDHSNVTTISSFQTILNSTLIVRNNQKNIHKFIYNKISVFKRSVVQSQQKKRRVQKQELRENLIDSLGLSASIWCLYDSKSKKHIGFRHDFKREIASLTKIMTTILSIEIMQKFGIPLNLRVKITNTSRSMNGTSADLKAGYWITLRDLLYGMMLPSGNDAAHSISEYLGFVLTHSNNRSSSLQFIDRLDLTNEASTVFYVQQFIKAMNFKAKELKLQNTCFSNPHGLSNAMNTSSAKDIIKISRYSVKNQSFIKIMNTQVHNYVLHSSEKGGTAIQRIWKNTNILLGRGWQGVKTGYTPTAGGCLSSLKDGIFIVVLNSENHQTRFTDTQKIYEWYTNRSRESALKLSAMKTEVAEWKEGGEETATRQQNRIKTRFQSKF